MNPSQLLSSEYLSFYSSYIEKVKNVDLITGLELGLKKTASFFEIIPEDKLEYRYVKNKWTIKEIMLHLIDAERVFAYRALRFSRQDKTPLPGFEENNYAKASMANSRTRESLIEEYSALRKSSIKLFKNFTDEMLMNIGTASNGKMSVRAIGFVIIGHELHHCEIIKERYL